MTTMEHPARHILLREVTDNEGMLREEETSSAEAGEKEAEMSSVLWTREQILVAMKRTARVNGGKPLGQVPFEKSTGIRTRAWRGKFWKNYSELVREAGLEPNQKNIASDERMLLENLVWLARKLGHIPTEDERLLERRINPDFPSPTTIKKRFGSREQLIKRIRTYCADRDDLSDIYAFCESVDSLPTLAEAALSAPIGCVYLIKASGKYKIGRSNSLGRREYEIGLQLPDRHKTIHSIETDDPEGIEKYWHERFKSKRGNGEWFALDGADVAAFKRRKRFM